jgi:hypothetical protein
MGLVRSRHGKSVFQLSAQFPNIIQNFPSLSVQLVQDDMSSSTEKAHDPCEWPEVVVCDALSRPELGTQANPILITDDSAPLGSASNPILIQVDEGWCRDDSDQRGSDANTVIMTTPEFWGTLTGGNSTGPGKDNASLDSSSIHVPTGSLVCENLDSFQPFDMSTSNKFALDHKAFEVTEDSFDAPLWAVRRESDASDHGGMVD